MAGVAAVALSMVQSTQAITLTGNIGFTGLATLNTASAGTATTITSYSGTQVQGISGVIAGYAANNDNVTFTTPWTFYPGSAVPITPFWTDITSGTGLTFSLSSWTAVRDLVGSPSVKIVGIGTMSDTAGDTGAFDFVVTLQDPAAQAPQQFSFSASSHNVPDGGTTALLLGAALTGLFLLRKQVLA